MPERSTFRHLSHACRDIEKTRKFYQEVMGFTFRNARDSKGDNVGKLLRLPAPFTVNLIFMQKDGFVLELQDFPHHGTVDNQDFVGNRTGFGVIHLDIKNLPEVLARVPEYGGEVMEDTNIGGACCVKDPDGAVLELVGIP